MKINDYFVESTLIQQLYHGLLTVLKKEKKSLVWNTSRKESLITKLLSNSACVHNMLKP